MDSESENPGAMLESLSSEDQQLFLEERGKVRERGVGDSPLLDQLCCLRLIMTRRGTYDEAARIPLDENGSGKSGGWRDPSGQ